MATTRETEEIPLPMAALRLGISGEIARRMVLRGELRGRMVNGRWAVEQESIDRVLRERKRDTAA